MTISVVVNTRNEEANLSRALQSVRGWADEIIVVDMESTDRTIEIARSVGAKVFSHPAVGFVEPAREFAIAQAAGPWILILDADEIAPPTLLRRLRQIADVDDADAVRIPRHNFLLGDFLDGAGWSPRHDRHYRFFKKGAVTLPARVHGAIVPRQEMRTITLEPAFALVHFNYLDTAHFLERLDVYTTIEARQAHERKERPSVARTIFRAAREFVRRYIALDGWRAGWRGLYLSFFMAGYHLAIDAKLRELREGTTRESVRRRWDAEAARLSSGDG